jgi:hypothetical protein
VSPYALEAAQKFCKEELGEPYDFHHGLKSWAAIDVESQEVVGAATIRLAYDIPMFHVKPGADREERKETSEPARNQLVERLVHYVQDNAGVGQGVFVHVAPEQQRLWRAFLKVINAQPSNRVIVKS